MTDRLYYQDSYRIAFEADVTHVEPHGGATHLVLDRTAFYPTSGGQPHDTGTLGDLRVSDVIDREDGSIAHVVDGTLTEGQRVEGSIDWPRRFDHMQQHTGQHLLSAAFVRAAGAETVSFHLGARTSTIDLRREVSPAGIASAVEAANRVVWENRAVTIRYATREEIGAMPLRKEPAREGVLRLIEVPDFDVSACGGTHVASTGAVGIIAIVGWERFKGGMRVEFVCGGRALDTFGAWRTVLDSAAGALSVSAADLPGAVERLQAESREARRQVRTLQARVADQEADQLAARSRTVGPAAVIVEAVDGWDAAGLKTLATAVGRRAGHLAILVSTTVPAVSVVARAPDLDVDAAAILGELIGRFGGRGGGSKELAQGGGLQGPPSDIAAGALEIVEAALRR